MKTQTLLSSPSAAASPEDVLAGLRWRIAAKKFDRSRKIPEAQWAALQEALILAPSAYGLQPWKFFVVEDPLLRAKLKPLSWDQDQITDADKLIVFAVKKDFGPADVERHVERTAKVRRVPLSALDRYKKMALESVDLPPQKLADWLTRQVYIALGVLVAAAAALRVNVCPLEGFEADRYDELLGLPAKGWNAVVVAAAGYRAADDAYAAQPKVRFAQDEVVSYL